MRETKRFLILIVASVFLTACQTTVLWDKPGVSQQEFNMDSGQCNAQAFSLVGAPMMQRTIVYQSCMQGKGYTKMGTTTE